MLNTNSFNIYTKEANEPNLVVDDEVAVATYTKFTKNELHYGYDVGLNNNYLVSNTVIKFNSNVINDSIKNLLIENFYREELANEGFMNANVALVQENQTLNLKITLERGVSDGANYRIG